MVKFEGESIIGGALAIVASFAWRDFFTTFIDTQFPMPESKLKAKFIYAILITSFVFMLFYLYMFCTVHLANSDPVVEKYMNPDVKRLRLPSVITHK